MWITYHALLDAVGIPETFAPVFAAAGRVHVLEKSENMHAKVDWIVLRVQRQHPYSRNEKQRSGIAGIRIFRRVGTGFRSC